ncbi:hypothetical protein L1049_014269 [Liquidambar formosana]|uniref:Uncharacterized protein n=1 Tax=Liquidambar formosana TaxID=63359 RepID=A0AAP0RMS2_LIQFO
MAQLDSMRSQGETPKTPTTPTIEQLLQDDGSKWPATESPTCSPTLRKLDNDQEEDHAHHHKKSVLAKVKETAKKFRCSLSKSKKHNHDHNTTPPWGVGWDDHYYDEDEDPEYLGAPMYESELAPEAYKETARHHRRAVPLASEENVLASRVKHGVNVNQGKEKPPSPSKTTTEGVTEKLATLRTTDQGKEKPLTTNKTITETVTEKQAPAYATVSEATPTITSKIQGLAVSAPTAPKTEGPHASSSMQKSDKGVSVKEYLMQKLEPGEDERALSQVISEAISPTKRTPGEMGMVEKVREAVTSFLWTEDSAPSTITTTTTNSSSQIPISTNAHEAVEEKKQGRILQAN